jgi:hypothetical protein
MVKLVAVVIALAACQGGGSDKPQTPGSGTAPPPEGPEAGFGVVDDAGSEVQVTEDAPPPPDDPEPPDPGKVIAELRAIPAWEAVIDRAQLLARRGQHGIVYGTIGAPVTVLGPPADPPTAPPWRPIDAAMVPTPYVWLVDDTEGNGTLGIRVELGKHTANAGDRVALGGAWHLDDARRWYWKVDSLTPVPAAPPSDLQDPPAPFPSHDVRDGKLPQGARMITVARDNDAVYFQIVGPPPVGDGDGWLVANELGDTPHARLRLPGERSAYGGQDMRAADERWHLKKMQTYWVRIGKIRKPRKDGEPLNMTARTAPIRLN